MDRVRRIDRPTAGGGAGGDWPTARTGHADPGKRVSVSAAPREPPRRVQSVDRVTV